MLDSFKRILFCLGVLYPCLWTSLNADYTTVRPRVYVLGSKDSTDICLDQAHKIESCVDLGQLIVMIVQIRDLMVSQGYQFPRLTTILDSCRSAMIKDGVEICDAEFEALREEFEQYDRNDATIEQVKHKHHKKHKKDKELKISSKTAMGFVKFIGGTLLCFVPIALIQTAGVSLAALGVSEMIDGAREQSDKNEFEERLDANRRLDTALEQ